MSARGVLNLLLIGQTGHGKTTLINSFVNHSKYPTFEEGLNGLKVYQIRSSHDGNTKHDDSAVIADKHDEIEDHRCKTNTCKSYVVTANDGQHVRFIDCPGFDVVKEPQHNSDMVHDVIRYISQYESIHAIAIVLKGNQSGLSTRFLYCVQQLMTNLEKSAVANLIFIFTNCTSTKAEDAMWTMKVSLKSIQTTSGTIGDVVDTNNTFCFENEAFNVLLAAKGGLTLKTEVKNECEVYWKSASDTFRRLMSHVASLNPHEVKLTLSVSDTRSFAEHVCVIAEQLSHHIESKTRDLEVKRRQVHLAEDLTHFNAGSSLSSRRVVDVRMEKTKSRRVVCTSETCVESYHFPDGHVKKHFRQICCEDCSVKYKSIHTCGAFSAFTLICKRCKCPADKHEQIYYRSVLVEADVVDREKETMLTNAKIVEDQMQIALHMDESELSLLENERNTLKHAVDMLANFIKSNAVVVYNDKPYVEQGDTATPACPSPEYMSIPVEMTFDDHLKVQDTSVYVSLSEIQRIKKQILMLEFCGPKIYSLEIH